MARYERRNDFRTAVTFRGVGGRGEGQPPELRPFQWLVKPGRPVAYGQPLDEEELTGPTTSTRVWADDVNGDGKLDLLVGDSVTLIAPAKGLSVEEFKTKFAAWQKVAGKTVPGPRQRPHDLSYFLPSS